jgi:hypothetical protein
MHIGSVRLRLGRMLQLHVLLGGSTPLMPGLAIVERQEEGVPTARHERARRAAIGPTGTLVEQVAAIGDKLCCGLPSIRPCLWLLVRPWSGSPTCRTPRTAAAMTAARYRPDAPTPSRAAVPIQDQAAAAARGRGREAVQDRAAGVGRGRAAVLRPVVPAMLRLVARPAAPAAVPPAECPMPEVVTVLRTEGTRARS